MSNDNEMTFEEKRELNKEKQRVKINQFVEDLFRELNKMGDEKEVGELVIEAIQKQHRTLQQNFFGQVICPIILDFAKRYDEHRYDLRNEASCKCANELKDIVEKSYFPFI